MESNLNRQKLIKVAAAVLNQTPLDWEGNQRRIQAAIAQARAKHASIVCLPELCITGYGCEDAFHSMNTVRCAWKLRQPGTVCRADGNG